MLQQVLPKVRPLNCPTLVFVCGCETEFDTRNELIGWFDPELTERGHEQAHAAAEKIVNLRAPLHHIYSGTLRRMTQTAQDISDATGVNVTCTDALNPWDVGELAGQQLTPELLAKSDYYRQNPQIPTPDGESFAGFIERWGTALKGAEDYVRQYFQKTLVLVTEAENHGAAAGLFGAIEPVGYEPGFILKIELEVVSKRGSLCCTVL